MNLTTGINDHVEGEFRTPIVEDCSELSILRANWKTGKSVLGRVLTWERTPTGEDNTELIIMEPLDGD